MYCSTLKNMQLEIEPKLPKDISEMLNSTYFNFRASFRGIYTVYKTKEHLSRMARLAIRLVSELAGIGNTCPENWLRQIYLLSRFQNNFTAEFCRTFYSVGTGFCLNTISLRIYLLHIISIKVDNRNVSKFFSLDVIFFRKLVYV